MGASLFPSRQGGRILVEKLGVPVLADKPSSTRRPRGAPMQVAEELPTASAPLEPGLTADVARNTAVQLIGRFVTSFLSLGALMILARALGTEATGDYFLVLSLLSLLNFSDMGITMLALRDLSLDRDKDEKSVILGHLVIMRTALAIGSALIVCLLAAALDYGMTVTVALWIGSLSYLLLALGPGGLGLTFAANLRMEYQTLASVFQGVTFLLLAALVLVLNEGVIAVVVAYDLSLLAGFAATVVLSRRFLIPRFQPDRAYYRTFLYQSIPVVITYLAWLTYSRVDMVLLSKLTSSHEVGLYGMSYRFVDFFWPINTYFVASVYPPLARHIHAGAHEAARRLLQRSMDVLSVLVAPVVLVLFVFPESVLYVVGSDEFLEAATSLRLLSIAIGLIAFSSLFSNAILAMGKQQQIVWLMPVWVAFNIGLNLLLIPRIGFEAAALTTLLTEFLVCNYLFILMVRNLRYQPSFTAIGRLVLVTSAGAAVALLVLPEIELLRATFLACVFAAAVSVSRIFDYGNVRRLARLCVSRLPAR